MPCVQFNARPESKGTSRQAMITSVALQSIVSHARQRARAGGTPTSPRCTTSGYMSDAGYPYLIASLSRVHPMKFIRPCIPSSSRRYPSVMLHRHIECVQRTSIQPGFDPFVSRLFRLIRCRIWISCDVGWISFSDAQN